MASSDSREPRTRLGLPARLAIGFGAIALVLIAGNWFAGRSAGYAIETLRVTEVTQVPLARAADALADQMLSYDRAVLDQLGANDEETRSATDAAEHRLNVAIQTYLAQRPERPPATDRLLAELRSHIAIGARLTAAVRARVRALTAHRSVLEDTAKRVAAAFTQNTVAASDGGARQSFAELEIALGSVRDALNGYLVAGDDNAMSALRKAQRDFRRTLDLHRPALLRAPGRAWMDLMDEDIAMAARLQRELTVADGAIAQIRTEFADSSAAVSARLDDDIAAPASLAVADAASAAAEATRSAQATYRNFTLIVIGLILFVATLTTFAVTAPVRKLIQASRALARGDWHARAPRGGPRELDELAAAFNGMATQLAAANEAVAEHQTELEQRVAARTRKLNHIAHHDPLTGLPNRRFAFLHLRRIARRAAAGEVTVGLLALDVDNFKSINDNLGHALGDEMLRAMAARLRETLGAGPFIARLGGDEFVVIVASSAASADLEALAERLVVAFRRPLAIAGRELLVSISVGASQLAQHAGDEASLVRAADAALFRAKSLGRNRVAVFSPDMLAGSAARFRTEQALRRAIEARSLALVFQPQVALPSGETTCVEALVRWRREDGSLVSAAEFIAVAEQSGLIITLGDWVLERAVSAAAQWRDAGVDQPRVAINVSAQQLLDRGFIERAAATLARHGLPAEALELELTESTVHTGASTIEALQRAREIGIGIALDDFGTGFSSLSSLSRLPLKRVKLDRSLVVDLDTNMRSAAIARAIISVGHSLGLEVTVEGIERVEQLRLLARCGPVDVQGHLLSRPLACGDVPTVVAASALRLAEMLERVRGDAGVTDRDAVVTLAPRR
jgi:diguanylate cyclase (GGDEF)-like protein